MSYYHRFKIVIGTPFWKVYLRWAYKRCIEDLTDLNIIPDFKRKDFTCLLCGVGNEATVDEFIQFVITKNIESRIIIIDIGSEQISAVRKLIQTKYPSLNIEIKQMNALELTKFLPRNSVDWIETDGFLEYFDHSNLYNLLNVWNRILKEKGFITLREFASDGRVGELVDYLRIWIAKKWLGVTIYNHTKVELEKMFDEHQLRFMSGITFLPTFRKYSLIKIHAK